jgi:hypothetical protein
MSWHVLYRLRPDGYTPPRPWRLVGGQPEFATQEEALAWARGEGRGRGNGAHEYRVVRIETVDRITEDLPEAGSS